MPTKEGQETRAHDGASASRAHAEACGPKYADDSGLFATGLSTPLVREKLDTDDQNVGAEARPDAILDEDLTDPSQDQAVLRNISRSAQAQSRRHKSPVLLLCQVAGRWARPRSRQSIRARHPAANSAPAASAACTTTARSEAMDRTHLYRPRLPGKLIQSYLA